MGSGSTPLDQLRKAELVYTRRLHVVLPCLAFGTPVMFPANEFRDLFDKSRLGLLHDIGFVYGEAVEMDVTPFADRFIRFLESALNTPIRPVEHPSMPIPVMLPDSELHGQIQLADEANPVDGVRELHPQCNLRFDAAALDPLSAR